MNFRQISAQFLDALLFRDCQKEFFVNIAAALNLGGQYFWKVHYFFFLQNLLIFMIYLLV